METENKINGMESITEVYESYLNGSFTQARFQIAEALENGINLLAEAEEITSAYGHGKFRNFLTLEICKYLAHTPKYEARQNVIKW